MSVAVTGVAGRTGQRLLRLLDRDGDVEHVVGLDVREPSFRPRSLEFHAVEVGGADLKPLVEGVDVLVHLAARFDPVPDAAVMERINVEGTRRVLDAAAATGVGKVVLMSSAFAYGAHPENAVPLTEDAPLRPNGGFLYAVHKAECERALAEWKDEHPGVTTTVLRPPLVLGGGTPPAITAIVRGRLPFRVRNAGPELQFVHVDDVASALHLAVRDECDGAYNVAPDGWLSHEEAAALAGHAPRVSLSADVAERMLRRLWRSGVGEVPEGVLPIMVSSCVVANDRLRALGWVPEHSNEEALLACLDEGTAPSGRRRNLWLALGTGGLGAAAALGWTVVRRRRA